MLVTRDHINQFENKGYFVLEKIISDQDLAGLRSECQNSLDLQIAIMESVGAETLGLSHKGKRYTLPCWHDKSPFLASFIFGDLMMEIVRSILGNDAYLFLELFVVKMPKFGIPLGWHQDSGYLLGNPHKPYISIWCALDDMTEDNGTIYMMPYSRTGSMDVVEHVKEKGTNDLVGYRGSDPGIAVPVPSGSIVVMSSHTFHRSGANNSDNTRRAFLVSYSPEPITNRQGQLWNQAVPFIKDGVRVFKSVALLA